MRNPPYDRLYESRETSRQQVFPNTRHQRPAHQNEERGNIRNTQNCLPILLQLTISSVYSTIFLVDICKTFFEGSCKSFGGEVETDGNDGEQAEADQLNDNADLGNLLAFVGL